MKRGLVKFRIVCILILGAAILLPLIAPGNGTIAFGTEPDYTAQPDVVAPSAVLIDARTGKVLYEKEKDVELEPAGTTKMMTALLALETLATSTAITIDQEAVQVGGRPKFLLGEVFKADDLLYAALMESSDGAAVALAKATDTTVEAFVQHMNTRAQEIGAVGTQFADPTGKHAEGHFTTAYNTALIAQTAMRNADFRRYVATASHTLPATEMQVERPLENTNGLLFDETHTVIVYGQRRPIRFEGATGIMLSNSPQAGYCMVASAERDGFGLIAVVLNAAPASAYEDTMEMFEYGFNNFAELTVMTKGKAAGKVAIEGGQEKEIPLVFAADVWVVATKGLTAADVEIRTEIPASLPAPVAEGDLIGKAEAWLNGTKIGETDLVAGAGVDRAAIKKFFSASGKVVSIVIKVVLAIIALLVIWVIVMIISAEARKRSRKRRRYGVDTHGTREVKRIRRIR